MKLRPRICLTTLALTLALTGWTFRAAAGDEKSIVDPTGTWKVTSSSTNAQARSSEKTLKLKLNGGTLTGTLTGTLSNVSTVNGKSRIYEWAIEGAKLQGNEISFSVTHPPEVGHGPDSTTSYQGKISGDMMTGTFKVDWMGHTFTRDWKAERLKE